MLGGRVSFKKFRAGNFIRATRVPHDDSVEMEKSIRTVEEDRRSQKKVALHPLLGQSSDGTVARP